MVKKPINLHGHFAARNIDKIFTSVFFTETEQRPHNIYLSAYLKGKQMNNSLVM